MNQYEKILEVIRKMNEKNRPASIEKGVMLSNHSCKIGDLILTREDLLISEHLLTGYFKNIDGDQPSKKDENTFVPPLKEGDIVAVYRFNDEEYMILAKLE